MARVVSIVPRLLTSVIGLTADNPPAPAIIQPSIPTVTTPEAPTETPDTSISGPDLTDDLNTIETRNRGRLGTIATSFRGVLNDSASILPRRTLLGE